MMKMVEVLGLPPQHLLADAPKVSKYFDRRADGTFVLKQAECRQVTDSAVCLSVCLFAVNMAVHTVQTVSVAVFPVSVCC